MKWMGHGQSLLLKDNAPVVSACLASLGNARSVIMSFFVAIVRIMAVANNVEKDVHAASWGSSVARKNCASHAA